MALQEITPNGNKTEVVAEKDPAQPETEENKLTMVPENPASPDTPQCAVEPEGFIVDQNLNLFSDGRPQGDYDSNDSDLDTSSEEDSAKNGGGRTPDSCDLNDVAADVSNSHVLVNEGALPFVHDCHNHKVYAELEVKFLDAQSAIRRHEETINRLENCLALENLKSEKLSQLEQTIAQLETDIDLRQKEHELDTLTIEKLQRDMETKVESLKKTADAANKDKEEMVMKYAFSESQLLNHKKEKECLEKKVKDLTRDGEVTMGKLKMLSSEKARVAQMLDNKCGELSSAYKEIDKLKEEINSRDIKIKWTQNKLKTEMEVHKDCPSKIDELNQKVSQMKAELEAVKISNQTLKKELQEKEQNILSESQLKEEQAKLILERHENSEREAKLKALQVKHQQLVDENMGLISKIQKLEDEKLDLEVENKSLQEDNTILSTNVSALQNKLVEYSSITDNLKRQNERIEESLAEMARLRKENEEMTQDMSSCRARESEMLVFTQQLTNKNVDLQSELLNLEAKAKELDKDKLELEKLLENHKKEVSELETNLKAEQDRRQEEIKLLARQVAEKTSKLQNLQTALEDAKSELAVFQHKHSSTVKELQRELQQNKKKLDQYENGGCGSSGSDSLCHASRTSSMNSLNDSNHIPSPYSLPEMSPHALVERIIKLQQEVAKHNEKIEFLEEHSSQLVAELKKKTKLLQNYMLREESGALASKKMDYNKAEISKHGGIMATLYGYTSKTPEDSITLELSLEINRKLQAVLEDTLLKNITLKENLDTLGDEISRLSQKKS